MDLVSIVIPIYNMGKSIANCVTSIIKQDYYNLEIILVDDGSSDDSYSKCLELAEQDSRIFVYNTENHGSGPARNYGIKHANGKYIYFPDADDYLVYNAISKMVNAIGKGKYDLVVFGYKNLNQKGKILSLKSYHEVERSGINIRNSYAEYMGTTKEYGIQGAPWNKFFDLDLIKKNAVEYPALRRHQDEVFIARYMCHVKNVCFIKDILYVHYVNNIKLEWEKYPINYIDIVIELHESRKETILNWNTDDIETKKIISQEFICNVIKALELSFSPKMNLSFTSRKKWIIDTINKSQIYKVDPPSILGNYQNIILRMVKKKKISIVIWLLHIKVIAQRFEFIFILKKLLRKN